jgi:hypothetical protein
VEPSFDFLGKWFFDLSAMGTPRVEGNPILPVVYITLDKPINGGLRIAGWGVLEPEQEKERQKRVRYPLIFFDDVGTKYIKRNERICTFLRKKNEDLKCFMLRIEDVLHELSVHKMTNNGNL